uniref:Uncharacterized protein n=1 Tax=viral metagenome TaxID=1070528 RepID=A0A6C0CFS0_9ZZZZ
MEEYVFVLHGIHLGDVGITKAPPKFSAPKGKKKATRIKVHSFQTHEGYTINIANTDFTKFESETPKVKYCWWDKCPYDEDLICLPYEYDSKILPSGKIMKTFRGPGSFCSIFCLWAYIVDEQNRQYYARDPRIEKAAQNAKIAFSAMFSSDVILKAAPHWKLLDIFGGPYTIDEFRKASYDKLWVKLENISFKANPESYLIFE